MNYFKSINCPQCGSEIDNIVKYTKVLQCKYCDSLLVYEDEAFKNSGKKAVLSDEPALLEMGSVFTYSGQTFIPIGRIRFKHKLGFWEEWYVVDNQGDASWISVDEGDFAIEELYVGEEKLPPYHKVLYSSSLMLDGISWVVTELGEGVYEGFLGQLPYEIDIGESFKYAHLTSLDGEQLMTLEYDNNDNAKAYIGSWIDGYEIKAEA